MLERLVTAIEKLAEAATLQAEIYARTSGHVVEPILDEGTPRTSSETAAKRTRRTKAEIEVEKAAAQQTAAPLESGGFDAPVVEVTKEQINEALKALVKKDNGSRDRAFKVLADNANGATRVLDVDPVLYPAILKAAQGALNG